MYFVLTTGRSGSTAISSALNAVPGLTSVHEPCPELILESSAYRYGEISSEVVCSILQSSRFPEVNGDVYCESNQTLSLIIPEIVKVFPEAKFIWLVRNGLDVVASAFQKQWYTGHSENHDRYADCSEIERRWIDGRIRADKLGIMTGQEWTGLDRFGKCCWYWAYVNQTIREDLETHANGRYFSIRLEELEAVFPKLLTWMGLGSKEGLEVSVENRAKRLPYHWTEWTSTEHDTFAFWCKEVMDQFYPSWDSIVGEEGRLLVAPAVSVLKGRIELLENQSLRERVSTSFWRMKAKMFL